MANPCALHGLTETEIQKVRQYVAGQIKIVVSSGMPFSMDFIIEQSRKVYDLVFTRSNGNKVMALNWSATVPVLFDQIVMNYVKDDQKIFFNYAVDHELPFDFNALNKVIRAIDKSTPQGRMDLMQEFLGLGDQLVIELKDKQEISDDIVRQDEEAMASARAVPPPMGGDIVVDVLPPAEFIATPPTGLRTTGLQNQPYTNIPDTSDPLKVHYYRVLHHLVQDLIKTEDQDSRNMILPGAINGVYIKFISPEQARKDSLEQFIIRDGKSSPYYAVPVARNGSYLYFDADGMNVPMADMGQPVLFVVPKIDKDDKGRFYYKNDPDKLKLSMEAFKRRNPEASDGEIDLIIQNELQINYSIQQKLLRESSDSTVIGHINGGSPGYIHKDTSLINRISNIVFPRGYTLRVDALNEHGKGKGFTYLYDPQLNNHPLIVERPRLSSHLLETVATLYTTPIINKDTDNKPLATWVRKELINQFIDTRNLSKELISITSPTGEDTGIFKLNINGRAVPLETPEQIEAAKDKIRSILTTRHTKEKYTVHPANLHIVQKLYDSGAIDPVKLTEKEGVLYYQHTTRDYKQFLEYEGIYLNYRTNELNQLAVLNPYLTFGFEQVELDKIVTEAKQEEGLELRDEYKGKFIYSTPGTGKSSIVGYNSNLVDADDLILKHILKVQGNTIFGYPYTDATNDTIGLYVESLYATNPAAADAIYVNVLAESKELAASGKTVLTGSQRFISDADIVMVNLNTSDLIAALSIKTRGRSDVVARAVARITERQNEAPKDKVKILDKMLYDISSNPVLFKEALSSPVDIKPIVKPVEKPGSNDNGDNPADYEFNADDYKNLFQKETEIKATEDQINAALEWYKTTPLAKHLPFQVIFNAVNIDSNAVAKWTKDGIILTKRADMTDYYHEAFHGFVNTFMTKDQREELYAATRTIQGTFTDYNGNQVSFVLASPKQLDEFLAEGFRNFMLNPEGHKFNNSEEKSIFQWLKNILRVLFEDVTLAELTQGSRDGSVYIHDLYQKLRVGNLTGYSFDANNAIYNRIATGMVAISEFSGVEKQGFGDSDKMVQTMDSFISEYVTMYPLSKQLSEADRNAYNRLMDKLYVNLPITAEEKELKKIVDDLLSRRKRQDGGFSISIIKNKARRSELYTYVLKRLNDKLELLKQRQENAPTSLKPNFQQRIDLLQWSIDNYGDPSFAEGNIEQDAYGNIKSVIGYHMLNTTQFDPADKEALLDNEDVNEDLLYEVSSESSRLFDDGGNNMSILDRSDPDLIYILRSLYKPDNKRPGLPEVNDLGAPKMMSFDKIWNNMVRMLEGLEHREDMYKVIVDEIVHFPAYEQLLTKIGSPQLTSIDGEKNNVAFSLVGFNLWSKIEQVFSNTHLPLIQTTIKDQTVDADGKIIDRVQSVTVGIASAIHRRIDERWSSEFQEIRPSEYNFILRNPETNQNYIDIEKAVKSSSTLNIKSTPETFISFMNGLGMMMDDSASVKYHLKNNVDARRNIIAIREKLINIKKYNEHKGNTKKIVINSLNTLINVTTPEVDNGINNLHTAYNELLKIESRYSDNHSNFMVLNAERNAQYEHTLNSAFTKIINVLNNAKKYPKFQDILTLPRMKYLDPNSNTFAAESSVLNSLFILDNPAQYGERRKVRDEYVQIEASLLSGIAYILNDQWIDGIANASADSQSKLLSELHNFGLLQTLEVMRHADKKTSPSFSVDYINTNGEMKGQYVKTSDFLTGKNIGFDNGARIMFKHLSAELERINRFKATAAGDVSDLQYDFKYLSRGQNFVLFSDMPNDLRKDLLKIPASSSLREYIKTNPELGVSIKNYLVAYLKHQATAVSNRIAEAEFIDRSGALKAIPRQALIESFAVNSIIHNLESLVILYGDPAMYAIEKEEFHKRNAGVSSTGTMFATGTSAKEFINGTYFNKNAYAKSVLGKDYVDRPYDGTIDTAVVKDPILRSAYYDELYAYKKGILEARGLSEAEITTKLESEMKPYAEMKIADAQGHISFDAYRTLRAAQGRWSTYQDKLYTKIVNNIPITESIEDLQEIFPPEKYQYWGQMQVPDGMMPVVGMHKFALIPLVPTVIRNNDTLVALHDKMMRENISYIVFQSGSKVGTITKGGKPDLIYEDDRALKPSPQLLSKEHPFTKNTLFLEYLKNQVDIAPNFKGKISFSSQMRKIIEDGLMEMGIPVDFMPGEPQAERIKAWIPGKTTTPYYNYLRDYETNLDALSALKKEELIEQMGMELDDKGNIKKGFENFINFVKRELTRREIGIHAINFLGVDNKGQLKIPLDLSLQADDVERMLNNIITKRLVKFKVKGEAFIQVSNAMFEDRAFAMNPERNFEAPTAEDLRKYGTIDLPYYRLVDGKVHLAKCKIALSGNFKELLYLKDKEDKTIAVFERQVIDGKTTRVLNVKASLDKLNNLLKDDEWLNMGEHRKMVTISGPRIPVQGTNSLEAMEVYEFLPEEAGPIIIAPAEIVAKSGSDFDKDTLFMMTPHIYRVNGKVKLYNNKIKPKFSPEELKKKIKELKGKIADEATPETVKFREVINDEIEHLTDQLYATKSGALENAIIQNFVNIISLPGNYNALTRPNDTDIVLPIAKELEAKVRKYDPTKWLFAEDGKGVSGTRILEMEYNLYKHESNNVGKQVLGIAAVDNTYNILMNRIGGYMKHWSSKADDQTILEILAKDPRKRGAAEDKILREAYTQTIHLKHNTMIKNGLPVISLSHTYDAANEYRIGDVISQLINGWVDVAKDAWIFNLQGNKEVAPTLLFMIQAGVSIRTAVYFASQPLVREYVTQQRLAKSAFGRVIESVETPDQPNMYRNQARANVLTQFAGSAINEYFKNPRRDLNFTTVKNLRAQRGEIQRFTKEFVTDILSKPDSKAFDLDTLEKNINSTEVTPEQVAAFLHFIELEDMSKSITKFKMATNVDTSRNTTVYSAVDRIIKISNLENDERLPGKELVDRIKTGSPIASFFVQDFQLMVANQVFPIRNSKSMLNFILKTDPRLRKDLENTYGSGDDAHEQFWNSFRNNAMSFLFQNALYRFNPDTIKSYKGLAVKHDIKRSKGLYQRVVVDTSGEKSAIYIDAAGIEEDFNSNAYTTHNLKPVADSDAVPYAALEPTTFNVIDFQYFNPYDTYEDGYGRPTHQYNIVDRIERPDETKFREAGAKKNQYAKFVIEREVLRSMYSLSEAQKQYDYKIILETVPPGEAKRELVAYERFLRDRALDNIFNPYKMFLMTNATMVDTFLKLMRDFPQLKGKYAILGDLVPDSETNKITNFKNLRLRNIKLTSHQINVYHENMLELSDPSVNKISDPETNKFISDFFGRFTYYGYIQSGLNYRGRYSLNKILPYSRFTDFMTDVARDYTPYLNQDVSTLAFYDLYYPRFIQTETVVKQAYRGVSRYKNYFEPFSLEYFKDLDKDRPTRLINNDRGISERKEPEAIIIDLKNSAKVRIYVDKFNMVYYKPTDPTFNLQQHKEDLSLLASAKTNKPLTFVYNGSIDPSYAAQAPIGDSAFALISQSNKLPIPTHKVVRGRRLPVEDDTDAAGNTVVNKQVKEAIDSAIGNLVKAKETSALVWNERGYGSHFSTSAPKTYEYLSQELARNFGYANPGTRTNVTVITALDQSYNTPMTYERAAEIYQKCITG
jgi:hypothetical protein